MRWGEPRDRFFCSRGPDSPSRDEGSGRRRSASELNRHGNLVLVSQHEARIVDPGISRNPWAKLKHEGGISRHQPRRIGVVHHVNGVVIGHGKGADTRCVSERPGEGEWKSGTPREGTIPCPLIDNKRPNHRPEIGKVGFFSTSTCNNRKFANRSTSPFKHGVHCASFNGPAASKTVFVEPAFWKHRLSLWQQQVFHDAWEPWLRAGRESSITCTPHATLPRWRRQP